jgi:MtfA peptidase
MTINLSILILIFVFIIAWIWLLPLLIKLRHRKLKNKPFPLRWIAILEENLPIYPSLTRDLKKRLHGHIHVFLAQKQFVGCNGLQITEEIKLTIAAQACLLLLNEKGNYYSKLKSILVYPNAYITKTNRLIDRYLVEEKQEIRIGESWYKDRIVLSWEHIKRDTKNWRDGHNVILHEFAHQLDAEDGSMNGVPLRDRKSDYITWALVFEKEYKQLLDQVERGLKTVIDKYGATNPAEFFAVATETFFEKPKQLQQKHPELYEELKHYYQLEPQEWLKN